MNTIEKRKIESVINADIATQITNWKDTRGNELSELTERLEQKPPAAVIAYTKAIREFKKEIESHEKSLKALGWEFHDYDDKVQMITRYDQDAKEYTHSALEVLAHQKETQKIIRALEALGRKYTLKIYAGSEEMEKLLEKFNAEISKILK